MSKDVFGPAESIPLNIPAQNIPHHRRECQRRGRFCRRSISTSVDQALKVPKVLQSPAPGDVNDGLMVCWYIAMPLKESLIIL